MASRCGGRVVYFARDPELPVIAAHRAAGGAALIVRNRAVVRAEGDREFPLIPLDRVPLTHGGRIGFQVENVLAAAAAAWHLGVPAESLRAGLESFDGALGRSPGRFNLVEVDGTVMVIDYGHNPSAVQALLAPLAQLPHPRRRVLFTAAGDRRDVDIVRQGELLGAAFDRAVLFEDHYIRGRRPGEIMYLLRRGLRTGGRVGDIREIRGWKAAVAEVLSTMRPGELWLIQADQIDESADHFSSLLAEGRRPAREITWDEAMGRLAPAATAVR
jgi:cyanophycin synthetase